MQTEPPWDDLRLLLALHRHHSFVGAAKALGVATSTIARRMDALETVLGRVLVHRGSGGTFVDADALKLVALAEQMELGLRAMRRDEGDAALTGTVRISLPEGAVRPVMERLSELRRRHLGLTLEILSEARLVDLARREADVGLRASKSTSPSVVHRSVGRATFGLYASPSYVERRLRGRRLKRRDFALHDFLGHDGALAQGMQSTWLVAHGATRFVVRSNSDIVLIEAAACGEGIALLADSAGLGAAGLVRLESDAEVPSMPIYVAYQRDLRKVPRVRAVVQALAAALGDTLR
ncbi:Transcriptional regulator, LysR family [Labilithrix luteola]|uniref:Transcriptional regulator, LysR family n=1 Tax=Labilithrix luteola TaxID=1391654 RepID=A0A0K1PKK2_9BACT|nr:LysR family transcriptional regulator [Labilithrix luteola]AKU93639.1 Transcriptional regulator, LysR family [Labilithrix luteola]